MKGRENQFDLTPFFSNPHIEREKRMYLGEVIWAQCSLISYGFYESDFFNLYFKSHLRRFKCFPYFYVFFP